MRNSWLPDCGRLSIAAALLHISCIVGGASWFRFFGAPPPIVNAVARGDLFPNLVTIGIAVVLAIWVGYAFAGAGVIARLPLPRAGLVVISGIYLWRGADLPLKYFLQPQAIDAFVVWSSLIVLGYGLCYAVGTWRAWPLLSREEIA